MPSMQTLKLRYQGPEKCPQVTFDLIFCIYIQGKNGEGAD
jgi:hypothetical protein